MIHNYLVLCLFGILFCFVSDIVAHEAIVRGDLAHAGEFKYQVSVQASTNNHSGHHLCGGGIIHSMIVISAAHCVINNRGRLFSTHISVVAGTLNLHELTETSIIIRVHKIYVPREFNPATHITVGDIAVLVLKNSLELNYRMYLSAITLPRRDFTYADTMAWIAGYGLSVENAEHSDGRLRYMHAQVLHNPVCQEIYPEQLTEKHVCARAELGPSNHSRGACIGDPGGPLVRKGVIIGILSRVTHECDEINEGPGIYTRVSSYLDFIEYAMRNVLRPDMVAHTLSILD